MHAAIDGLRPHATARAHAREICTSDGPEGVASGAGSASTAMLTSERTSNAAASEELVRAPLHPAIQTMKKMLMMIFNRVAPLPKRLVYLPKREEQLSDQHANSSIALAWEPRWWCRAELSIVQSEHRRSILAQTEQKNRVVRCTTRTDIRTPI